jgi:hypothetical protein
MSFMAVIRNPHSGALFAMVGDGEQVVKEWKSAAAARRFLNKHTYAKAWGFQILEVESHANPEAKP